MLQGEDTWKARRDAYRVAHAAPASGFTTCIVGYVGDGNLHQIILFDPKP